MSASDDVVIRDLAASEAQLFERVVSLESDVRGYRELAQTAIHQLHALTADRARLREQLARLRDEYRALREQLLRQDAA